MVVEVQVFSKISISHRMFLFLTNHLVLPKESLYQVAIWIHYLWFQLNNHTREVQDLLLKLIIVKRQKVPNLCLLVALRTNSLWDKTLTLRKLMDLTWTVRGGCQFRHTIKMGIAIKRNLWFSQSWQSVSKMTVHNVIHEQLLI